MTLHHSGYTLRLWPLEVPPWLVAAVVAEVRLAKVWRQSALSALTLARDPRYHGSGGQHKKMVVVRGESERGYDL